MFKKLLPVLLLMLAVGSLFSAAPVQAQEKSYRALRYDVEILVQPYDDLLITETVVFEFSGGPFTYVFREIPRDMYDDIAVISASLDGEELALNRQSGAYYEVESGDPLRLTWHFGPSSNTTRTFTFTYRVVRHIHRAGEYDVLDWDALPNAHEYTIGSSEVRVRYPESTRLGAEAEVRAGNASIQTEPGFVLFMANDLAEDDQLRVYVPFRGGSLIGEYPAWHAVQVERQAATRQALPVGIAGGVLALVLGSFGLLQISRRNQSLDRSMSGLPPAVVRPATPPSELPPALAGALTSYGNQPAFHNALGTLFDLARRGVVIIDELPKRRFAGRDFAIRIEQIPANLLPHEQVLLEALQPKPGKTEVLKLSELGGVLQRDWTKFSRAIDGEMEARRLVSVERKAVRTRLMGWGGALLALGFVIGLGLALVAVFIRSSSPALAMWLAIGGLGLGAGLFVAGLVGLIAGSNFSALTDAGVQQETQWRGFWNYLKDVSHGREAPLRSDFFELYLPLTAAFGVAKEWARVYQKSGTLVMPAWFQTMPGTDASESFGAFYAFVDSSSATGDAGGAGGAGGGGGGGSSGAG